MRRPASQIFSRLAGVAQTILHNANGKCNRIGDAEKSMCVCDANSRQAVENESRENALKICVIIVRIIPSGASIRTYYFIIRHQRQAIKVVIVIMCYANQKIR